MSGYPLHDAILENKSFDEIKTIVDNGADVNKQDERFHYKYDTEVKGLTPLQLVAKAAVNAAGGKVILASKQETRNLSSNEKMIEKRKQLSIFEFLVKKGANYDFMREGGNSARGILMKLFDEDNDYYLSFNRVIQNAEAGKEAERPPERFPLHAAIKENKEFNLIQPLIYSTNDVNEKDDEGNTPLLCAVIAEVKLIQDRKDSGNQYRIIEYLKQHGVHLNKDAALGILEPIKRTNSDSYKKFTELFNVPTNDTPPTGPPVVEECTGSKCGWWSRWSRGGGTRRRKRKQPKRSMKRRNRRTRRK
jgi:ankyrin repeat protein